MLGALVVAMCSNHQAERQAWTQPADQSTNAPVASATELSAALAELADDADWGETIQAEW